MMQILVQEQSFAFQGKTMRKKFIHLEYSETEPSGRIFEKCLSYKTEVETKIRIQKV